jgi:hypothetical protein
MWRKPSRSCRSEPDALVDQDINISDREIDVASREVGHGSINRGFTTCSLRRWGSCQIIVPTHKHRKRVTQKATVANETLRIINCFFFSSSSPSSFRFTKCIYSGVSSRDGTGYHNRDEIATVAIFTAPPESCATSTRIKTDGTFTSNSMGRIRAAIIETSVSLTTFCLKSIYRFNEIKGYTNTPRVQLVTID